MQQCDRVRGWVQLKYRLCKCKCGCEICRCKINDLIKEQTEPLSSLSPPTLWVPETPFALLTPIRLPYPLGPFLLPCLLRPLLSRNCLLCFPNIAGCLGPYSASEIASDAHPVASAAGLQSHCRT